MEEGRGEERELEQEEIELRRKDIEEVVEVFESDLPATLSTIPNKYCSLSEAQGLKQLISIPTGNHISITYFSVIRILKNLFLIMFLSFPFFAD